MAPSVVAAEADAKAAAAAVAGAALRQRLAERDGVLGQTGQRVELGEDADHRLAAAPLGHERRGHVRHARPHREAGIAELLLEERGALLLLEAQLGETPDLFGDVRVVPLLRIDALCDRGLRVLGVERHVHEAGGEYGESRAASRGAPTAAPRDRWPRPGFTPGGETATFRRAWRPAGGA